MGQASPRPNHLSKANLGAPHRFFFRKTSCQRQQAKADCIAINPIWIEHGIAQHLQATTNAEQGAPFCRMFCHRVVQALRSQPGQVAAGVFGAWQDDPVGAQNISGAPHPFQVDARNVFKRLKFVQVADVGIGDHSN